MNRVEWELYGETNVDQVTDKTNKGLDVIGKNAKRVENSFNMGISAVFLRFLGPLVLIQQAISMITEAMEKAKQTADAGFKALAAGEDNYATAQESRMAAFFQRREQQAIEKEQSEAGKKASTEKFMEDRGFWRGVMEAPISTFAVMMGELGIGPGAGAKWIQNAAAADFEKTQKGVTANGGITGKDFKSPEGFSNVVGVGANPVLDTVTMQLEIQKQMLTQLEIANSARLTNEPDFTKGRYDYNYGKNQNY
jgi:hypothetical protein